MILHNSLARVPDYSPEHTSLRRRKTRSKRPESGLFASVHLHFRAFAVAAHVLPVRIANTGSADCNSTDRVVHRVPALGSMSIGGGNLHGIIWQLWKICCIT